MKSITPLISCICVTNQRPGLLTRALCCFSWQTYATKELIISYPEDDFQTQELIRKALKKLDLNIVQIKRNAGQSLGAARNDAIAAANGEYICIWDDDDWYHTDRLRYQYDVIKKGPFKASIFMNIILFDAVNENAYFSRHRHWEGTLLCEKKTAMTQLYLDLNQGEDTSFITGLSAKNVLFHIKDASFMYIYIYHGQNTWDQTHFNDRFSESHPLDYELSLQIREMVRQDKYHL